MLQSFIIYTDGSCIGTPSHRIGGWAYLIEPAGIENSGHCNSTTNNRMELSACIEALAAFSSVNAFAAFSSVDALAAFSSQSACVARKIILRTDSRYIIDGLSSWLPAWKRNGWRTTAKGPVKNIDLWLLLDSAVTAVRAIADLSFEWVKAHAGIPGNERVDFLAKSAAAAAAAIS